MSDTSLAPIKYPELTDEKLRALTPADDDCRIPHEARCQKRAKTCKNPDCQYRFPKSDRNDPASWFCPKCGKFRRCRKAKVTGYNACSQHGIGYPSTGKIGGSLPTTFTSTKWIPERLKERFEEAIGNPELLSMKNQMATLDSRWKDVLSRLETASFMAKENFKEIKRAYQEFDAGRLDGDELIERVRVAVDDLRNEQATWQDVSNLMEQQRKLSETEMKRMVQMNQTLTVEEANTLVGQIRVLFLTVLKPGTMVDDSLIQKIQYELLRLTHQRPNHIPQPV